ncbi:BsuBI/PstI family type II restriction endonuclease [Actinomyces wuliandei]|uniref:BsuBI/PstI family type II restriction endonuclease n=1 Tax=Actinomyces wuliandei TaxID=2057743 RepID=UPI001FAADD1D|nr:BsuBI/PstI family type II restriction endonuclease [Actinomyces wuliandei]
MYVGDADSKTGTFEHDRLAALGVVVDEHGKMPDLVVYQPEKNWLFLMEAASTHGPVDSIRYSELSKIFRDATAGLVYVSCFPDRAAMRKFLAELAWETGVWLASDPTHMIHLDGSRFLGPYGTSPEEGQE